MSDNICAGILLDPDRPGHGLCRCCGISLPLEIGGEADVVWNISPGGQCWECAFWRGVGCDCDRTGMDEDGPDHAAIDDDLAAVWGWQPCPECGQLGACGWDDEGRPMIHPTRGVEDDQ